MQLPEKFQSGYDHAQTEKPLYEAWDASGYFNPETCIDRGITAPDAEPFSIVLPPPNVTGRLHVGHSAMLAIEDIIVRYKRMQGLRTLWIPGTDHAAIATQSKFEKDHYKETKKSRHDYPRDEFVRMINEFALDNRSHILGQLKAMGSSLDWSRLAFTLDEKRERAVRTAFKKMHEDGLIYRGYRVVNWDPKGQTTVSDDEVLHEESDGMLYTFRYASDFPIPIATTRPETKVGDTAVAVHPEDARYKEYIGQTFDVNFAGVDLSIQIIADEAVDPEFGTGAVGITPAHSLTDWEIASRHKLPMKKVINEYAKMENVSPDLEGLKTKDAREKIVQWMKEQNLVENEEKVTLNLSVAERSGGIIEPLPKEQWFIDVNKKFRVKNSKIPNIENGNEYSLKDLMKSAVTSGETSIIPDRFEKIYNHWIENLHDWCISRQIVYGHQIPVWYRGDEIHVGLEAPEDEGWTQDPDTLDTWFSSGLWTFSTLGWPDETPDLETYHPNSMLETGYDILFFWVARMILMSTYLLGEVPFRTVYLHGLVRDKEGRKMSKSIGNVIDPLDLIEKYGADALRMALIVGSGPGNDVNMDENNVRGYRKFSNKVWNIAKFVLMNLPDEYAHSENLSLLPQHQSLVEEAKDIAKSITEHLDNYRLHLAAEEIYHFIWHRLADEIVEEAKPLLNDGIDEEKTSAQQMLVEIFSISLKLLHPFMPYVTEAIWQNFPAKEREFLMIETWPTGVNS